LHLPPELGARHYVTAVDNICGMFRIFITGGSGFLGSILANILSAKYDVSAAYLNSQQPKSGAPLQFDIRDAEQVTRAVAAARPDFVIHTAALTKPDYCETRPEETRAVNVTGTTNIVNASSRFSAKLIHVSTDLVFDGKKGSYSEDDAVRGLNEYSRSKIDAEHAVLSGSPGAVVLRLSIVYGPRHAAHPGFLDEMLMHWQKGQPMGFFTDQYRNPTFAPQVADAIEKIIARPDVAGIFHLGGAERLSRYEFATMVARIVGAPVELVGRASMFDHHGPAERPQDCSLISEKIGRVLGVTPMRCEDGLSQLMQQGYLLRL
jgi:dTDP-4-dehydrorhamnose reductase